jgi:lysophospholipase L1-like esterase
MRWFAFPRVRGHRPGCLRNSHPAKRALLERLEQRALLAGGRGFTGYYFAGTDFTTRKLIREDSTLDFHWTGGTPDAAAIAPGSGFGARFSARVMPKYSEEYRFYTRSTGGVRLWVNNKLIIDDFTIHPLKDNKGTIKLTAGVRYDIKLEYLDTSSASTLQLQWASSRQARETIPSNRLFASEIDTAPPPVVSGFRNTYLTDTAFKVGWNAIDPGEFDRIIYATYLGKTKLGASNTSTFTRGGRQPNTPYNITVRAYDFAGNEAITQPLTVTTRPAYPGAGGSGLAAEYFESDDLTNFRITRTDPAIEFAWVSSPVGGAANDPFSARWTGTIVPKYDELYTFYTLNDGGVRLLINGQPVIDAWTGASTAERTGRLTLRAGQQYDLVLEYRHQAGDPSVMASWSSLSQARQIIPTAQLFPAFVDTSAPSAPTGLRVDDVSDSSISLSWDTAQDNVGVASYNIFRNGALVGSTTDTSYTDQGLSEDTQYSYSVSAVDGVPLSSAGSSALGVRTDQVSPRDAFAVISAIDFNISQGATRNGNIINSLDSGDWVRYSRLNFGGGANSLRIRLSSSVANAGGRIEVRLDNPDGQLVGTHVVQPTGSTNSYYWQQVGISSVNGQHDLYFVFRDRSGVAQLESFQFRTARLTRIMPLGDSITQSDGDHRSYRYYLYNNLLQSGYNVDFVGSMIVNRNGSPTSFDFDQNHEGHQGFRADQILGSVDDWVRDANPEIVMLHIGSNDLLQLQSPASTATEIGQIIDAIRSVNPSVRILLAQILPLSGFDLEVADLNSRIASLVISKNTAQSPVVLVDMNGGFSAGGNLYDGVHPNDAGERKMSDEWFDALEALLA